MQGKVNGENTSVFVTVFPTNGKGKELALSSPILPILIGKRWHSFLSHRNSYKETQEVRRILFYGKTNVVKIVTLKNNFPIGDIMSGHVFDIEVKSSFFEEYLQRL